MARMKPPAQHNKLKCPNCGTTVESDPAEDVPVPSIWEQFGPGNWGETVRQIEGGFDVDLERLSEALNGNHEIPQSVRGWLANNVTGIKRKQGKPPKIKSIGKVAEEFHIAWMFHQIRKMLQTGKLKRVSGTPTEDAYAFTIKFLPQYYMNPDNFDLEGGEEDDIQKQTAREKEIERLRNKIHHAYYDNGFDKIFD